MQTASIITPAFLGRNSPHPEASNPSPKDCRLLVIESCASFRGVLQSMTRLIGAECKAIQGGRDEVMSTIDRASAPFSTILCDVDFDGPGSGAELLRQLRRAGKLTETCFVMMSSDRRPKVVRELLSYIPDALLLKPFSTSRLQHELLTTTAHRKTRTHTIWQATEPLDDRPALTTVPMAMGEEKTPVDFITQAHSYLSTGEPHLVLMTLSRGRERFPLNRVLDIAEQLAFSFESWLQGQTQHAVARIQHVLKLGGRQATTKLVPELRDFSFAICKTVGLHETAESLHLI